MKIIRNWDDVLQIKVNEVEGKDMNKFIYFVSDINNIWKIKGKINRRIQLSSKSYYNI
jgi:hypothetical protein